MKQLDKVVVRCREGGFTIIEFIIATLVFSVLLLLLTTGIIQITRSYYKGVIETNTQNSTRNLVEAIGQSIQFSKGSIKVYCQGTGGDCGGSIPNGTISKCVHDNPSSCTGGVICTGYVSFSYALSRKLSGPIQASNPGISVENAYNDVNTGSCPLAGPPPVGPYSLTQGNELLNDNMRLVKLDLTCTINFDATADECADGLYTVDARVAYGDDDLLCSPSVAGDCDSNGTSTSLYKTDITCKGHIGQQFCAVSEISSNVQRRLAAITQTL